MSDKQIRVVRMVNFLNRWYDLGEEIPYCAVRIQDGPIRFDRHYILLPRSKP